MKKKQAHYTVNNADVFMQNKWQHKHYDASLYSLKIVPSSLSLSGSV